MNARYMIAIIITVTVAIALFSCGDNLDYNTPDVTDTEDIDNTQGVVSDGYTERQFVNTSEYTYISNEDNTEGIIMPSVIDNDSKISVYNDELYFMIDKSIIRFNPETYNITGLCPDPLCNHFTLDCPFYFFDHTFGFYIYDNEIYYHQHYPTYDENRRENDKEVNEVVKYNLENGVKTSLRDITANMYSPNMIFYEDSCYYVDITYNDEKKIYEYAICKQDLNTLKIDTIYSDDVWTYTPSMAYDGKLYIYNSIDNSYFYKNIVDGTDTEVINNAGSVFKCDNYFIYKNTDGEICKCDLNGNNIESLNIDNVDYMYITNNYIYYMQKLYKPIGVNERGDTISINLSPIYRTNHDGSDVTVIFTPDYESDYFYTMNRFIVQGRYLYSTYDWFDKYNNVWMGNTSKNTDSFIRYDTITKEVYYINFE